MNGLTRWVPRLIIATALLHFVWAFAQPNSWAVIAREGFFRTNVDTEAPDYFVHEATIWFMASGVALLAIGTLAQHVARTTGRLPAQVGWYMLIIGVPLSVIYFPVTGSWPLLVIGALGLVAARRPGAPSRSAPRAARIADTRAGTTSD
ncbi:DUF6463 family protein [Nonomuraea africana]|uniref:Uncharacterized protein n=1 Tax=Nonomuraea africana TaxID=46171 RepID=A0ABR9K5K0_9ACTN|nr:DUF6463 family protein [Nonomuraea africana]MBE1557296.1 hypothetical protein [Nonomuraea africana]